MGDVLLSVTQKTDPGQDSVSLQLPYPYPFRLSNQYFSGVGSTYLSSCTAAKSLISVVVSGNSWNTIKKASAKQKHGVMHTCLASASCLSPMSCANHLPHGAQQVMGPTTFPRAFHRPWGLSSGEEGIGPSVLLLGAEEQAPASTHVSMTSCCVSSFHGSSLLVG